MKSTYIRSGSYNKFIYATAFVFLLSNLFATITFAATSGSTGIKSTNTIKPSSTPKPKISPTPSKTPVPMISSSPTNIPNSWFFSLEGGKQIDLNSTEFKWVTLDGQLHVIAVENGQLVDFVQDNDENWSELERFGPEDSVLTTFQLLDVNNDNIPEIIAGTVDPGFICVYKLVEGKWVLSNFQKYVWSAITNIAIGSFDGASKDLLVQNQDGFLFLLSISDNSLDLIWKSPNAWRPINSFYVLDINKDGKDEIIVSYKMGAIGILKIDNNQVVSIWENYAWGKILGAAKGDWDNDSQPEFIFSTVQKVLYILGYDSKKGYLFESQLSQLNYTIEKILFRNYRGVNQLLLTDTSGKLHLLEYNTTAKTWVEDFVCITGRIAEIIIKSENDPVILLGQNHKIINLRAFPTKDFKLVYLDNKYNPTPAPLFLNNQLYIAPNFFNAIPDLGIKYTAGKKGVVEIKTGDSTLSLSKKDLKSFTVGGVSQANEEQFIVAGDNLYLMRESYQNLFHLNLEMDQINKTLVLSIPVNKQEENIPENSNTENTSDKENPGQAPADGNVESSPTNGSAENVSTNKAIPDNADNQSENNKNTATSENTGNVN